MTAEPARTTVYTDGACLGNPGPGGWAWAVVGPDGPFGSGPAAQTTNQRMEITAVLEATRALDGPLDVVSDSTYVVNCWRDRWWESWIRNGWKNKARKDVANRDLWEPLVAVFQSGRLTMRWVKGHGSDPMNDLVDRLAVEAARTQTGRTGVGVPTDLGEADDPAGASASAPASGAGGRDPRLPEGRLLVVTGHRPPELGGYDSPNPIADDVRNRLIDILAAKHAMHPDLAVLTGLGLGAEQLGAEAAEVAGIPYLAVLPFPDVESVWPAESKRRFRRLAGGAKTTVLLQAKPPESRQQAGAALRRRDAWLGREADEAIVVWDGADDLVGRQVRALQDALGEEEVWLVDVNRAG